MRASQMALDFPRRTLCFEDLKVTGSNRTAFAVIRGVESWPGSALCLKGPAESGLTTAARAWAEENSARFLHARFFDQLSLTEIEAVAASGLAIDRTERLVNWDKLLSAINLSERLGGKILLTSRTAPKQWPATSPDLLSRLEALVVTELLPPDEDMMSARLTAAGRARYLKLEARTVSYLATRLETSYAAIEDFMRRLDTYVTETGKAPAIPLVRTVLDDGPTGISTAKDQDG